MAKSVRISLANKCQLLFGAAVVLILTAALTVGWLRMQTLVVEGQREAARELARSWLGGLIKLGNAQGNFETSTSSAPEQGLILSLVEKDDFEVAAARDMFLKEAIDSFLSRADKTEFWRPAEDQEGTKYYRYARAIRQSDLVKMRRGSAAMAPAVDATNIVDPVEMVLLIQLRADQPQRQLMLNRIYIVASGLFAGLLAIGAFWFITTRIILSPVRVLRDTAEKVSEGNLNIRSDINTGDEFEQLSDMFNHMLENLNSNEALLRQINKSLDLKLGELAQSNVALYEANKIKGEFLANVSHELRTPLNSIIGFGELLEDTLKERTGPVDEKRKRYVSNIITSSRNLLELINDLLDLAKIEAGRMDLHVGPMNVADTAEGLLNLIRPQAGKRQVELRLRVGPNIPLVQTDARKFEQVIFNFLSNALKYTPANGAITLSAELIQPESAGHAARLRVSVTDTGPGIPPAMHDKIFEKFTQLDATVTREHGGTGLGLTISRELAAMLQGRIELESEEGKGATFSLIIPTVVEARSVSLMPDLAGPGPVATR